MSSWITQLITLLAVVVGALATFVSNRITDRNRWRREERFRWDNKKLECYYEYANALMQYVNIGFRVSGGRGLPGRHVQPISNIPDALQALDAAEAENRIQLVKISMIGSPNVIAAARKWRHQALLLEQFARGLREGQAGFDQAGQTRRQAEDSFYEAVRADLGIVSRDFPRESDMVKARPNLPPDL
jgi:hypothetical protein